MFFRQTAAPIMPFPYLIRKSKKARCLKIEISVRQGVVLIVPERISLALAYRFLLSKSAWVSEVLARQALLPKSTFPVLTPIELRKLKRDLRELIFSRLERFAPLLKVGWSSVAIRDQKTRWGSCSKGGILSFNYRLAFLPSELLDYIIVHELCHLKELNHSVRFWKLVEGILPDYQLSRKKLKKIGPLL